MSLIRKGGFRERANRNHKYGDSENQQASLKNQKKYQPKMTEQQLEQASEPAPLLSVDLTPQSSTQLSKDI